MSVATCGATCVADLDSRALALTKEASGNSRVDLIREPAFYCVFYFIFPIYLCLFHHNCVKMKSFVRFSSID